MISIDDRRQVTDDPIDKIISGDFELPETGERVRCPVRRLVIERSLDGHEHELLKALNFPAAPTIVCDPNTHDVLANRVAAAVPDAELVVLNAPRADEAAADRLVDRTRHAESLIAVGAGTLNDLVKYVSHRRQCPYAVFATAPSMNGYVTATASISRHGQKLSLPAAPPIGAFFDLTVLAEAPPRLIQAGVGDSLCRTTAELDWLLSHHLLDTTYLETPFAIQAGDEATLLAQIGDVGSGKVEAIEALVRLLVLGGLGMLIAGSSQPGSQGEHLISHYIDMWHRPHPGSLHGEQVGLATRTMAGLQHHVLTKDVAPALSETRIDPAAMANRFGRMNENCRKMLTSKALTGDRLDKVNQRLTERWSVLREAFKRRALPLDRLQAAFAETGVAAEPRDLGIAPVFYREAVLHARELRDRFTMLDLAADAGLLDPFVDQHLFEMTS